MSQPSQPSQSLRASLEPLARILKSTPDTLYERQRSLVRAGLLKLDGRGRGGGTKATPRNLAALIIAFLCSDSPVDAGRKTRLIAAAKPVTGHCLVTGAQTFLDAITWLLSLEKPDFKEQWPEWVSVSRGSSVFGEIEMAALQVDFTPSGKLGALLYEPVRVKASLHGPTALKEIRKLVPDAERNVR